MIENAKLCGPCLLAASWIGFSFVPVQGAGGMLEPYFSDLPEGCDPATVSRRITDQFLTTRPENSRPHGQAPMLWIASLLLAD